MTPEIPGDYGSSPADCGSSQFQSICDQLTIDQLRFVTARMNVSTDKEAAAAIGVSPDIVSYWKKQGYPIDEAVKLLIHDGLVLSRTILRRSVAEAAAVKRAGLYSDDEKVRQSAATEVLDRELGKAMQPQAVTHDIQSDGRLETYLKDLANAMAALRGEIG